MKKLFALRGAAAVKNDAADIAQKTALLYDALLEKNNIAENDIVSLVFSVTNDIDAKNPAAALRESGRAETLALFCVQEAFTKDSFPCCIRALMHCYMDENAQVRHVYTAGAEKLRPDRKN